MHKRVVVVGTLVLASLAMMTAWPVRAVDFRSNRTDGIQYTGFSTNQQSSNQAYNIYDILSDPGAPSYGLYWKGGLRNDPLPLVDNREQDPELTWTDFVTRLGLSTPRPTFTPNVPQGWSPIVIDLDRTGAAADHFLVNVSLDVTNTNPDPLMDPREQVITAYWPETANGLGNLSSQMPPNRLEPLQDQINNRIWRIKTRELDPIQSVGGATGVVTQPPIYSFVDGEHLLYLVIGTGENNDPAKVVCLRIPPPIGSGQAPQVPDPADYGDIWDPNDPGSDGMVVWSYDVQARSGSGNIPVAGISFADFGDTQIPRPNLYITTQDGQLICLNARPVDQSNVNQDGDPRAGQERWKWLTPATNSPLAGFAYGMTPAVCRVPLSGAYPSDTLQNAVQEHHVDEWMVFVADDYGAFRAFDAGGEANNASNPTQYAPRLRWQDAAWQVDNTTTPPTYTQIRRRADTDNDGDVDANDEAERFKVPPVVYQGGTPMTNSSGVPVGAYDSGYDDEVIFASERGRLYVFKALGKLTVSSGASDGEPVFETANTPHLESGTVMRWQWPESDTSMAPASTVAEEPRVWPREHNARVTTPRDIVNVLGAEIPIDGNYYVRSALATSLGANANPNSGSPNLDLGDDLIFVPYLQDVTALEATLRPATLDATKRYFHEYVASLKPYPFVQAEYPIEDLVSARITWTDPATMAVRTVYVGNDTNVPAADQVQIDRVFRIGTVKSTGVTVTQATPAAGYNQNVTSLQDDTAYMVDQSFYYPPDNAEVFIPFGPAYNTQVELTYTYRDNSGTLQAARTDPPAPLPSCYRRDTTRPGYDRTVTANDFIVRGRASLSVNRARLQLQLVQTGTVHTEHPAQVDAVDFTTFDQRPPSMFAAGSANAGGLVLVPIWYRGRVIALNNRLQPLTALPGLHDTRYGAGNVLTSPFDGDPGPFVVLTNENFVDHPEWTDIGASVTEIDGWLYLTYRNGHTRAWSNQGGGAPGTDGPNTPIFTQPPLPNFGNRVRAPVAIRLLEVPVGTTPTPQDVISGTYPYRDVSRTADGALLLEYGEDVHILVDFGDFQLGDLRDNSDSTYNPNEPNPPMGDGFYLDSRLLDPQNVVQAQLLSSIGAIGQLAAPSRGVGVYWNRDTGGRCFALITLNTGFPSGTNPLTPGTPVLREKAAGQFLANEALYYLQVTQSGVQWLWPHSDPNDAQGNPYPAGTVTQGLYPSYTNANAATTSPTNYTQPDPRRIHYWTIEPNQGATRFPKTAGPGNWTWLGQWREYAPLLSYNNPLVLFYDPVRDDSTLSHAGSIHGMYDGSNPINGIPLEPTSPSRTNPNTLQFRNRFTSATDQGRKNGDVYVSAVVDGARSGVGQPLVPTVGVGVLGGGVGGAQAKQFLFGQHGRTTPDSATLVPDVARLRVGDRSYLGTKSRNLTVRVQRAPLTKMGIGAAFGGATNPGYPSGAPMGSLQQNVNIWDDGPDGLYPSIAESRLLVTKTGTTVDLASGAVAIPGRATNGAMPGVNALESLTVQVDIPSYTPDDVYTTRWRTATPRGSAPWAAGTTNGSFPGVPGSLFNPFWPGQSILGLGATSLWDRSEARATSQNAPAAPEPDPLPPGTHDPAQDDRLRRVVVFVDADNDGKLDLEPNRREAYRTFAVQVVVQPDMKLETQTPVVDFGSIHHGKKQPGLGGGALEIREYQRMNQLRDPASPAPDRAVGNFYNQWWRKIVLVNSGNVNLAYVKPELIYQEIGQQPKIRALPAEGNDWFRALPLVQATTASALADPFQIFLRTSFDDQMLPDASLDYAAADRGLWLQKAPVGGGLPGTVAYADNIIDSRSGAKGQAVYRDPSLSANNWQNGRELWMSLNLPTGSALGQYSGTMTYYNDRMVTLRADIDPTSTASVVGYTYGEFTGGRSGLLERQVGGEPVEPMIDPPIQLKARVTETLIQGRYQYTAAGPMNPTGTQIPDRPDRRIMPAASLAVDPSSSETRLRVVYASNRAGIASTRPQPLMYDLWGTELLFNATRGLFPYDELPDDRAPWSAWPGFTNPTTAFSLFTNMNGFLTGTPPSVGAVTKPSLVHDLDGNGILAWTDRLSTLGAAAGQGTNERFRIVYQGVHGNQFAPMILNPGGQVPDPRVERSGVRMVPTTGSPAEWFAFYAMGSGPRHGLGFTWSPNPANPSGVNMWRPEHTIPTSRSLSSIQDPHVFLTEIGTTGSAVPEMAWTAYAGASQRRGLTDVYLSRFRLAALRSPGQRGTVDQLGKSNDYGMTSFPRVNGAVLQANPNRTLYSADGIDWITNPTNDVKVYLVRPDKASGAGSPGSPLPLLGTPPNDTLSPTGERVAGLDPALIAAAPAASRPTLQAVRIIADAAAGTIRFTIDTRMLARLLVATPAMTADSPDPLILADYTPQTLRLTRGDVSAHDPVIVPVLSDATNGPVYDASWFLQHRDGTKWSNELPVAGIADRLWVFWRRTAGAAAGSPSCYYKVLRPGVRVRAGAIRGITSADLTVTPRPEEVNPQTGQIYFPANMEGQVVTVAYRTPQGAAISETHRVSWQDETGERPVPMEAAVNEGSLDAFASYEMAAMTAFGSTSLTPVRKMERVWLFWSSTRGSGGDIYSATLAPRIGPEVAITGSATAFYPYSASALSTTGSTRGPAPRTAAFATYTRRRPFVLPPLVRRGPLVPVRTRPATRRAAGE